MTTNKNFCETLQSVPTEFPVSPVGIHIGHQLRKLRVLLHLSPDQLAEAAGLDPIRLLEYESGVDVSAAEMWHIANVFNLSPDFFFSGMDDETRKKCWQNLLLRAMKGRNYKIPAGRDLTEEEILHILNMMRSECEPKFRVH